jgi:hypothetical protein
MPDRTLDIHLELDPTFLRGLKDPTQTIAEIAHAEAENQALKAGARLRHPEPADIVVDTGISKDTGREVLLVATRWICD